MGAVPDNANIHTEAVERKKKSKKQKQEVGPTTVDDPQHGDHQPDKRPKKRKHYQEQEETNETEDAAGEDARNDSHDSGAKKKRRANKDTVRGKDREEHQMSQPNTDACDAGAHPIIEPPKKKRRNKTGLPDPKDEASLTDQARKGEAAYRIG
ncbi:hypothetical protein AX16_000137 [Volvariella volvacea WC 439]|nr:hypothetical protein AX16_000137 [Volvariella volvacea WC 439]